MDPFERSSGGIAKKTTFTLSAQAVLDIEYITQKKEISIRTLLDHLCSEMTHFQDESVNIFLRTTLEAIDEDQLEIKRSWSVGSPFLSNMKRLSQKHETSRNALVDGAIRAYRKIIDYEDPIAKKDLERLWSLLKDINTGEIFEKYGISLHSYFAPLSKVADDLLADQLKSAFYDLGQEVFEEYKRVYKLNDE